MSLGLYKQMPNVTWTS